MQNIPRYTCSLGNIDPSYRNSFVPSRLDAEGEQFLAQKFEQSAFARFLETFLELFYTDYEVDGFFHRYPMHLLATPDWEALVGECRNGTLLDIGAGEGYVTAHAEKLFSKITATETAHSMCKSLRKRGYSVYEGDLAKNPALVNEVYDVVSLLNVLDRCEMPATLLRVALSKLKQNGLLLIATPLPFHGHVSATVYGGDKQHETLFASTGTWEGDANTFFSAVLAPFGLSVERFTRLPYMSNGQHGPYVLDDFVVVCKRVR